MQEEYGKSVFLSIFCKYLEKKDKTILIIDNCEGYGNINNIFGKTLKENNKKISKNINYEKYKNFNIENNYTYLEKYINKKKKDFNYIFLDCNLKQDSFFHKNFLIYCDEILFLIEPNLIELEKAKGILEIYKYDFEIPNNKIKIIFNKSNRFQISTEILKEVFEDYEILGNIKYSADYNLYINKNTKYFVDEKEYEKIYIKLFEQFNN